MTNERNETTPSKVDTVSEKPESASPTPELEQPAAEPLPTQESGRFQSILRTALIGLAAIIVVFLAGFLTDNFTRYGPMKATLTENMTQSQNELSQANQNISDLQNQIDNLNDQLTKANSLITSIEQDKVNLQAELDSANLHIELLMVLVELKTARNELGNDNIAGAKVALSNTSARLEKLKPLVETVDATLAVNMRTRLNLILTGMDSDLVTAQADLDLLAKNLQSVETLLFNK